jgi:ribosome-binding protein aMBF1 (putative translation factor)
LDKDDCPYPPQGAGGNRAKAARLAADVKAAIRAGRADGKSYRQLAAETHVDVDVVRLICRGQS